jgi:hypothetical protein
MRVLKDVFDSQLDFFSELKLNLFKLAALAELGLLVFVIFFIFSREFNSDSN